MDTSAALARATRAPRLRRPLAFLMAALAVGLSGCVVAPPDSYPQGYSSTVYVTSPPPQPMYEMMGPPPAVGYVWIDGYWLWQYNRYVWIGGRWEAPRAGYHWVPHTWQRDDRGWWLRQGHWDRAGYAAPAPTWNRATPVPVNPGGDRGVDPGWTRRAPPATNPGWQRPAPNDRPPTWDRGGNQGAPGNPGNPGVECTIEKAPKVLGYGLVTGLFSGFFGIGGGFLIVPGLVGSTGMPIIKAIGTSLVAVAAFGLTTALTMKATTTIMVWRVMARSSFTNTTPHWY